jgi:hypothetical protein
VIKAKNARLKEQYEYEHRVPSPKQEL